MVDDCFQPQMRKRKLCLRLQQLEPQLFGESLMSISRWLENSSMVVMSILTCLSGNDSSVLFFFFFPVVCQLFWSESSKTT